MLKRGSKGFKVKVLQRLLNRVGFSLIVDGIFGPQTEKAVRLFQASHNLVVDGIVGPKTWKALLKAAARKPKPSRKVIQPEKKTQVWKLNLVQMLIPPTNKNRPGGHRKPKWVTIHDTANPAKGADAVAHAKYYASKGAEKARVSVHAFVDDKRVVQTLPWTECAWHSGTKKGNLESLAIEICENADGNRAEAEKRAAMLTAYLLKMWALDITCVRTHQSWSGKFCPHILLSRKNGWETFLRQVVYYLGQKISE